MATSRIATTTANCTDYTQLDISDFQFHTCIHLSISSFIILTYAHLRVSCFQHSSQRKYMSGSTYNNRELLLYEHKRMMDIIRVVWCADKSFDACV